MNKDLFHNNPKLYKAKYTISFLHHTKKLSIQNNFVINIFVIFKENQ